MAGSIFISYRREDEQGYAARLYERLVEVHGKDRVFFDVDSIPPGFDFVRFIDGQIRLSDVVLVVIGRNWLDARDDQGKRRLDNPADFVRIEVEAALRRKKHVVPILVQGASMPRSDDLPQKMRALTKRNAFLATHVGFRAEVDRLVSNLSHPDVAQPAPKRPRTVPARPSPSAPGRSAKSSGVPDEAAASASPTSEMAGADDVRKQPVPSAAPEGLIEGDVAGAILGPAEGRGGVSGDHLVEDETGTADGTVSEDASAIDYSSVHYVPVGLLAARGTEAATLDADINAMAVGSVEEPPGRRGQNNAGMAIFMTIVALLVTALISMIYISGKL